MEGKKDQCYYLDISMADEERLLATKTILGYESAIRGLTIGQTLCKLVVEAVDVDRYPADVREQLRQIREESRLRASEQAIEASRIQKSA